MLKTILVIFLVLGVLAVVGAAWAKRSGYCSPEHRIQHLTERLGRRLDLNDDQQGRLATFVQTLKGLRSEWQGQRAAMKERVSELLATAPLDRDQAQALIDERAQIVEDGKHALIDAFANFSDSLAPEQRSRLAELIGDRMNHRWGHTGWAH